jgi:hypothetical protein
MNRLWIVLSIWFLCLIAAIKIAVYVHNKDQPNNDWKPSSIAIAKEKVSDLYKKLNGKRQRVTKKPK